MSSTRTAEQERWSRYYLARDLHDSAEVLSMLVDPARTVPIIPGEPMPGRTYSAAVDTALHSSSATDATIPLPPSQTLLLPPHRPADKRSPREKRANKRRYKKAKAHYGKTYVLTKSQVIWIIIAWLGTVMLCSSLLFVAYIKMVEALGVFTR
jgi:hypothetical protein